MSDSHGTGYFGPDSNAGLNDNTHHDFSRPETPLTSSSDKNAVQSMPQDLSTSPPPRSPKGILPRDRQLKTPTYDYAFEKSMSHAEAKLFYQHHQLESRGVADDEQSQSHHLGLPTNHAPLCQVAEAEDSLSDAALREHNILNMISTDATEKWQVAGEHPLPANQFNSSSSNRPHATSVPLVQQSPRIRAHEEQSNHLPNSLSSMQKHNASPDAIHGMMNAVSDSNAVTSEMNAIGRNIWNLLNLRSKYIDLSLQGPGDNPNDQSNWRIYPPPPEPAWEGDGGTGKLNEAPSGEHTRRKMGQNIGEDFDMAECLPLPEESDWKFKLDKNSVYQVYECDGHMTADQTVVQIPSLRDFYMDLDTVIDVSTDGPTKSFAFKRLSYLEGKFQLYALLNEYQEIADSKKVPHRDFYNVRKVDTHVHHSACMNQKHLLRFIKSKMKKSPDEVVLFRDGKHLTLKEVFESINLTAYDLSIDTLDMHVGGGYVPFESLLAKISQAHTDSFHRFDKFNLKYNPVGESRLREIFLKTDNYIKGRYLAEITKEVIADLESSKYQMVEWRISIYGRSIHEWDKLAAWVVDNKLFSPNVRWLIQVPRLYDVYKSSGMMENFEQVIMNVFQPLFEVTRNPSSHPKLHMFLQRVVGFDSVDDESKAERRLYRKYPIPREWNTKQNPPYSYWIYFMFANISSLNFWRKHRGFNTFVLRPHCGEAGDPDHLAVSFLCCHSISHGILLRKVPLLQYLFYLDQIGIAMSPLSNNALFLTYDKNPCANFFKRGLNISLSTDDPLQFAFTKEPLIEEYSVAAQIYKFSAVDMCELAKHSVQQSGFELSLKQRWLGSDCHLPGVAGNNVAKSNVPDIREEFRHETLVGELTLIERYIEIPNIRSRLFGPQLRSAISSNTTHPGEEDPSSGSKSQSWGSSGMSTANNLGVTVKDVSKGNTLSSHTSIANTCDAMPVGISSPTGNSAAFVAQNSARPENIPEQKIFPGIVHGRSQRSTVAPQALPDEHMPPTTE